MKSLNTYLTEKLVIFPSQVDEKLVINKNFKGIDANDEFYNKFCNILSADSDIGWIKPRNIKNLLSLELAFEDKNAIDKIKEFFNTNAIYSMSVLEDREKECALYYDILKFIADNKDDMKFFYINEQSKSGDYLIYLFETGKLKVAVCGHEKIVDTCGGTIVFQHIK